jgi:hypothetical protein
MKQILVALAVTALFSPSVGAQCENWQGPKGEIDIKAPVTQVWEAVHHERASDPDLAYSKVIQQKGNQILLEQKFNALPVIGEATCLMVQQETPLKRIDYKLVRSDKFKEMSGSWVMEPKQDGTTALVLYSRLDTGLPFSQGVIDNVLQDKINKRLSRVKASAEALSAAQHSSNL